MPDRSCRTNPNFHSSSLNCLFLNHRQRKKIKICLRNDRWESHLKPREEINTSISVQPGFVNTSRLVFHALNSINSAVCRLAAVEVNSVSLKPNLLMQCSWRCKRFSNWNLARRGKSDPISNRSPSLAAPCRLAGSTASRRCWQLSGGHADVCGTEYPRSSSVGFA